jgi:CRP-like cAMP-binding protein/hemerythrin-like domain-containing protein
MPRAAAEQSRQLQQVGLFRDIRPFDLDTIVELASERDIPRDSFFFHQGNPAASLYILNYEQVKLTQLAPDGQQVLLNFISPGEIFGGIGAPGDENYHASAQAAQDSVALAWDSNTLARFIDAYPRIAQNAMRHLSRRVQKLLQRTLELANERMELRHRMACIGCPMSRFETLEEAAAEYRMDLTFFCARIAACRINQGGRGMKITEALLRDHQVFHGQFEDLERALRSGTAWSEIEAQIDVLNAALETHAELEDELLFSALEPHIGPMGPLAVMRMEHDEIENAFFQLQESADPAEREGVVTHLLEVARSHFAKEEQILFPMADQELDSNALEQLGVQFANRRRIVMI